MKLYFKTLPLSAPRVQAAVAVMIAVLATRSEPNTQFGILDVKRGKLFGPDLRSKADDVQVLSRAEARAFAEIWEAI